MWSLRRRTNCVSVTDELPLALLRSSRLDPSQETFRDENRPEFGAKRR